MDGISCSCAIAIDYGASCKIQSKVQEVSGHDFSRAEGAQKSRWALAPAAYISSHLQLHSG
jgi:hypothetical protein